MWSFMETVAQSPLLSFLVLAWLLLLAEFGLFNIALIFVNLAETVGKSAIWLPLSNDLI